NRCLFAEKLESGSFYRRQNLSANLTETDAITVALTPTGKGKAVAIFQPFAVLAAIQFQWIGSAAGEFEHTAARIFGRATDCSAGKQIARLQIASAHCVMGKLLRNSPVKILKVGPGDRLRRL